MRYTPVQYLKIYGISLAGFLVIDLVWIGLAANSFYRNRIGYLLADTPNWAAAILFYMMFIAGIVYFAVRPGLETQSMRKGLFNAALFGLMTYGTYDLTNLALVKSWPVIVTVVDMIWGTVVAMMVAAIGMFAGKKY